MKGWKKIIRSAHQNAQMKNAFKDKPSGKEIRGADPYKKRTGPENLANVLPDNISGKKRALIEKRLFPAR